MIACLEGGLFDGFLLLRYGDVDPMTLSVLAAQIWQD